MAWFVKWYAPYVSPAIERIAEEQARHKAMLDAMIEGLAVEHGQADDEGRLKVLGNRSVFSWMRPPSSMSQGFRWPSYDEPLRDRITSRPKVMKDIVCSSFGYAVSDKARQVIEAVEPGVHQFLPFCLRQQARRHRSGTALAAQRLQSHRCDRRGEVRSEYRRSP